MENYLKYLIAVFICLLGFTVCFGMCADVHAQDTPPAGAAGDLQSVTVKWDANDPAPEGYRVFMRKLPADFVRATPVYEGPETQAIIADLEPDATYGFVVIAYDGVLVSADSDQVIWKTGDVQKTIVYPPPVKNISATKVTVSVTVE